MCAKATCVPDERKNAMIVVLHKEKRNKSECKSYGEGDNQMLLGIHLAEFLK